MMSISEAMDRLVNLGLIVRYNQDENRISGGYEIEADSWNLGGLTNSFSIQFDGEWHVQKKFVQLRISIPKSTLAEAVDAVYRLYQTPGQFSDLSITIEDAVEKLGSIGLPVNFIPVKGAKRERITICFENASGDDCTAGISIYRNGGYFLVIKFATGVQSSILYYGETLLEAVTYILSLNLNE